jgi:DNA uptake protein ComE-like DNA-binding protein
MPEPPPVPDFPWTAGHRRALIGLLSILLVVLAIRYARNRAFISDPQPETPARAYELADHLDPNTCTWEELAAIPYLGEKKAKGIVTYRERWLREHPNDMAFRGPQDLRNVKGIGPATVSNMMPFLVFPKATKS